MQTPRQHYSTFTLTVHWLTVVLVLTQIGLLWISADMPRPERMGWVMTHKSIGLTLLFITLVRLGVRIRHPALPLPATTPGWQKFLGRATEGLFYALLIIMPLAGWFHATAMGRPIQFFGLFEWPAMPFVEENKETGRSVLGMHKLAGKVMIGLICLHVLGALKHWLIDRDNVLQRMLPFLPQRTA